MGVLRILLIAGILIGVLGCIDPEAPADSARHEQVVFEVSPGSTASSLTDALIAKGLLASEYAWRFYLYRQDARCIKAGRHRLSPTMGMRELLETLCESPLPEDIPFTVVEGWRARDVDAALTASGLIEAGAYLQVVNNKTVESPFIVIGPTFEGYLFPETYGVLPDRFDVEKFVIRQLETFQARVLLKHPSLPPERLHDVVIMASMLEREEPDPKNRPLVAGILWKRLENHWALGVDATSRYTLDDPSARKPFLKKLNDPLDPYNTRLHRGLPPTAIGNPGVDSIEAALAPVSSPYWYYLHDARGVLHSSRSAAEHASFRDQYDVH